MKRSSLLCIATALAMSAAAPAFADQTLFYNGAPNYGGSIDGSGASLLDCSTCRSAAGVEVYDDFTVPVGQAWTIDALLGNYELGASPLPTTGTWALVQGITAGNGGTVIASGSASLGLTSLSTPPGGSTADSYYQMKASITPVVLAPGTYWMMLAPASASNETYLVGTDGTNGTNALIDGVSYANGTYFSYEEVGTYLHPFTGYSNYDFSYGVSGTTAPFVPEPGAGVLALAGCGALIWLRRRSPRQRQPRF